VTLICFVRGQGAEEELCSRNTMKEQRRYLPSSSSLPSETASSLSSSTPRKEEEVFDDPKTWTNYPVYFCRSPTMMKEMNSNATTSSSLPLNTVIPFETQHFKGKMFFRILKQQENDEYFLKDGRQRLYQVVVQGQFTSSDIKFSDVYIGAKYDKPFEGIPLRDSFLLQKIQHFIQRINPGMIFDISADRPRIMTPIGSCQKFSINEPGQEPDLLSDDCLRNGITENTTIIGSFTSIQERRAQLSDPSQAKNYQFDPSLVYTFEIYDHMINFATYKQHFSKLVKIDLSNKLNGQPLSITAMVINKGGEEDHILYDFHVWHERLMKAVKAKNNNNNNNNKSKMKQQVSSFNKRNFTTMKTEDSDLMDG
jgi:hypothetical protein